jgi:membrane protein implicated in regulation of membrane protease activity
VGISPCFSGYRNTGAWFFLSVDGGIRIYNGGYGMANTLVQIFVFSILSVITITAWRFYGKKHPIETDQPLLNKRGAQYIGRVFNLYEAIENGQGKIKADHSIWKVHGEDCDIKTRVKVIASRGTVFDVEKVD